TIFIFDKNCWIKKTIFFHISPLKRYIHLYDIINFLKLKTKLKKILQILQYFFTYKNYKLLSTEFLILSNLSNPGIPFNFCGLLETWSGAATTSSDIRARISIFINYLHRFFYSLII